MDTTPEDLAAVRREIDRLDRALVTLIRERTHLAATAADTKTAHGLGLRDVRREAEVVRRATACAREMGIDVEPVRDVFWRLIDLSHRSVGHGDAGRGRSAG